MTDNILDKGTNELLTDKLKHHLELAEFHQKEASYIRRLLGNNVPINVVTANPTTTDTTTIKEENYTKVWYWTKQALPHIQTLFSSEEFTTGQLVDRVIPNSDKDYRGKVVYAVSTALGGLVKAKKLKSKKEDGIRGLKYYL